MDKELDPMKLDVIVDRDGKIAGTAHHGINDRPHAGQGGPVAGPHQTLHVIEVPADLQRLDSAEELHRRLAAHIPSR
jgi:hypothetical protein